MQTGTASPKTGKAGPNKGHFKPGVDPRRPARGPGRPKLTPEEAERRRLARIAHDRVVHDVAQELRQMVGVALDKLRDLLDSDDPAIVTRVAQDIVSRVNGTPVTTNIVHASLATAEVRKLTADDVQAAARQYLLRQGAALAEEVVAIEQGEPVEQEP